MKVLPFSSFFLKEEKNTGLPGQKNLIKAIIRALHKHD
jgi:hypothetical protein